MLLGLIFDNIVVFLWRVSVKTLKEWRSRNWPQAEGEVLGYVVDQGSYPYVDITFGYQLGDRAWEGTYTKPFWHRSSAYEYGREVAGAKSCLVRYDPNNPASSVVREADQQKGLYDPEKITVRS